MGKNSLTKSTSKKKKAVKKDAAEEKPAVKAKSTAKSKTTKPKKTAAKKTTAAKSKATTKTKKTVKAKSTAKPKKTAKTKATKKVTVKDLIFKKFEPLAEEKKLYVAPVDNTKTYSAPPFITSDDQNEIDRIKNLLKNKYSMADIKAAAEKAAAEKAAAEKAAAEKAAAEKAAAEKAAAEKAAAEKAAAEKAAAEKAAAEKAAAEKAAAEKAAAEKAAAEKAAAEKAAAEKAAAEKAAAEKAAAEKAAAEKAAAEKAAAEKAAAEKAAAEKAAAEKAAAEKAAAEKAAAEKAAAEKAAAEKAAAEKVEAEAAVPPPPVKKPKKPADPQEKVMKIALSVFALIILYLIAVSYSNMNTFSLKDKNGAVELWQGYFSPMGEERVMVLPGAQLPDVMKQSGSKKDIFPFVVNYYLNKADTIYEVPGIPDFQSIESYLNKAEPYAVTSELKNEVNMRKTAIDFTVLLTRADVAINSGTPEGFESAIDYLSEAKKLDIDDMKTELVNKKLQSVEAMMADFEITSKSDEKKPEAATESPHH